ncbi:hypothetical protein [Rhizobium sp. AAP43]|uniref:hypothetical protein n=1 Tax=Rhizobium sp. AAP43 TaxID=1523420 RepID=UPI000AEF4146|nr:hypothetical protein [Rhizobium sp. AAP43]
MRTRWEEDSVVAQGHHRKFSILPLALGMAVPVAFIAGAAITSYISMSPEAPDQAQQSVAQAQSGGGLDGQLWTLDEQKRCAVEVETNRADAAGLRQQLEALQSQVIAATREKEEAERKVASALADKAAAEAEVARVMTAGASQMSDRLAPAEGEQETAGGAVNALALASEPASSSSSLEGVSEVISPASEPVGGPDLSGEPEPESSMDMTAAVTETAPETSPSASGNLTPRSTFAVADALSKAPGLDALSGSARQDLEARLVRGECVSSSLATAFNNHVPVVPLRDLIRNLDSDC